MIPIEGTAPAADLSTEWSVRAPHLDRQRGGVFPDPEKKIVDQGKINT